MISLKTVNRRICTRLAVGFGAVLMLAVLMAVVGVLQLGALVGMNAAKDAAEARFAAIGSAVAQLDRMTQQNAALVEQSAASAESLKDQAIRLNGPVGTFRLENQGA